MDSAVILDDFVQTFELESSNLRGRIVKLGPVLDNILNAHSYPLPISHMVAETMVLSLCLSSMLKYEGIFTLQAQGDGPVKMVVADVTSAHELRGCATFDKDRFQNSREQIAALKTKESSQNHLAQYLGKGYVAFTVDQGAHTDRYQGIVELKGASMVDCVQHYFNQSEQIGTGIKMAVGLRDGKWRGSAIMLQHMPEDQKNHQGGVTNAGEDDWRRAMILLDSCTDDEFLAPDLSSEDLLYRLFHEEGVIVYNKSTVENKCRCDEQRVENILYTMSAEDVEYMAKDEKIIMTCEFCSHDYIYNKTDVLKRIEEKTNS